MRQTVRKEAHEQLSLVLSLINRFDKTTQTDPHAAANYLHLNDEANNYSHFHISDIIDKNQKTLRLFVKAINDEIERKIYSGIFPDKNSKDNYKIDSDFLKLRGSLLTGLTEKDLIGLTQEFGAFAQKFIQLLFVIKEIAITKFAKPENLKPFLGELIKNLIGDETKTKVMSKIRELAKKSDDDFLRHVEEISSGLQLNGKKLSANWLTMHSGEFKARPSPTRVVLSPSPAQTPSQSASAAVTQSSSVSSASSGKSSSNEGSPKEATLQAQALAQIEQLQKANAEIPILRELQRRTQQQLEATQATLENANKQLSALSQESDALKADAAKKIAAREAQLMKSQEAFHEITGRLEIAEQKAQQLEAKMNAPEEFNDAGAEIENAGLKVQLESSQEEVQRISQELNQTKAELEQLQNRGKLDEKFIGGVESQRAESEAEISDLQQKLHKLEKESGEIISELRQKLATLKDEKTTLEREKAELKEKSEAQARKIHELDFENERMVKGSEASTRNTGAKNKELQAKLDASEHRLSELQILVTKLKASRQSSEKSWDNQKALAQQLDSATKANAQLREENASLQLKATTLEASIQKTQALPKSASDDETFRGLLRSFTRELQKENPNKATLLDTLKKMESSGLASPEDVSRYRRDALCYKAIFEHLTQIIKSFAPSSGNLPSSSSLASSSEKETFNINELVEAIERLRALSSGQPIIADNFALGQASTQHTVDEVLKQVQSTDQSVKNQVLASYILKYEALVKLYELAQERVGSLQKEIQELYPLVDSAENKLAVKQNLVEQERKISELEAEKASSVEQLEALRAQLEKVRSDLQSELKEAQAKIAELEKTAHTFEFRKKKIAPFISSETCQKQMAEFYCQLVGKRLEDLDWNEPDSSASIDDKGKEERNSKADSRFQNFKQKTQVKFSELCLAVEASMLDNEENFSEIMTEALQKVQKENKDLFANARKHVLENKIAKSKETSLREVLQLNSELQEKGFPDKTQELTGTFNRKATLSVQALFNTAEEQVVEDQQIESAIAEAQALTIQEKLELPLRSSPSLITYLLSDAPVEKNAAASDDNKGKEESKFRAVLELGENRRGLREKLVGMFTKLSAISQSIGGLGYAQKPESDLKEAFKKNVKAELSPAMEKPNIQDGEIENAFRKAQKDTADTELMSSVLPTGKVVKALLKQNEKLPPKNDGEPEDNFNYLAHIAKRLLQLSDIRDLMLLAFDHYYSHNSNSVGLFHWHGEAGRERATTQTEEFLSQFKKWEEELKNLDRLAADELKARNQKSLEIIVDELLEKSINEFFVDKINNASGKEGNHYLHSWRTYQSLVLAEWQEMKKNLSRRVVAKKADAPVVDNASEPTQAAAPADINNNNNLNNAAPALEAVSPVQMEAKDSRLSSFEEFEGYQKLKAASEKYGKTEDPNGQKKFAYWDKKKVTATHLKRTLENTGLFSNNGKKLNVSLEKQAKKYETWVDTKKTLGS